MKSSELHPSSLNLHPFLDKFELFADAPNAVAKMRELVLELAVNGALSERHASDQDDAAWREFVTKFDQRSCDSDSDSQPPFEIPAAWRWACLDDLGTTRVRNDVEDSTLASFVPMALISSTYGIAAQSEERTWSEIKKGFTHFADGDVVMAKITPCFENAKSAVMRNLVNGVGAGTTELHVFRPATKIILPEFVLLYVKTRGFIMRGEPRMTGSAGQKRVPREYFATSPFPLPPFAEQKRIVAKVDELMALCDRLEAQQQERQTRHAALARASLARFADVPTPANLHFLFHSSFIIHPSDLRKSILTLAVQGKLVPQDPNDEPAEADFEALVRTRENSPLKRTKIDGEATAEDPLVPDSWMGVCLGELVSIRTGFAFKSGDYTEHGTFILRVTNINPDGSFDTSNAVYLPDDKLDDKMRGFLLDEHELLVVMVGGSLGKIGQVTAAILPALLNQNMWRLKPYSDRLDYRFLGLVLHDLNENRLQITPSTHGHLAMGTYAAAKVPFPPLAEQRRIVAKVDQLMALVDQLEAQLAASVATAGKLMDAVVAELTAQA